MDTGRGGSYSNPRVAELAEITKYNNFSWDLHDLREWLLCYSSIVIGTRLQGKIKVFSFEFPKKNS